MIFSTRSALFPRAVVLAALFATATVSGWAKESALNYLKEGKPDASAILAPPPLPDSPEQTADLDEVRAVHHAAGSNDVAAAYLEKKFSVFNFADAVGPYFESKNLPKTTAFFEKVQSDAATITDLGKDYFKRPRPFVTDPSLANGKLEKSFGYPSGHSTESMVLALVLANLLPEKHDAIIAHARAIGWHRVQIARHYPTDIYAGRMLALAIVKQFQKNDAYQKDFEAVRAELKAAQP